MTLVDHAVKLIALLCIGAGDAIVREYACQHPFRILLYEFRVMLDLSLVAGGLLIAVCTDAAVRCDPELWLLSFLDVVSDLPSGRDDHNVSHQTTSPFNRP